MITVGLKKGDHSYYSLMTFYGVSLSQSKRTIVGFPYVNPTYKSLLISHFLGFLLDLENRHIK